MAPIPIIIIEILDIMILFFIGISVFHMKKIENGRNVAVRGFESNDTMYDTGERIHAL